MVWRSLISNQMSWVFDGNRRKMLKLSTFALTRCNTEHMVKKRTASIIKQQPLKLQTTLTELSLLNLRLSTWYGSVLLTCMDPISTRKLAMKPNPHVSQFSLFTVISEFDKVFNRFFVNWKFFHQYFVNVYTWHLVYIFAGNLITDYFLSSGLCITIVSSQFVSIGTLWQTYAGNLVLLL